MAELSRVTGGSRPVVDDEPTMPAVSILLPVYNAGRTLADALRSVQRQSDPDWECVVADDGSTDDSLALANRFAASDPRFVVVSLPHAGIVAALNAGLSRCRAEFVARMDGDDLMQRQRLEKQRAWLTAHPTWAGVGCHVRFFPRRGMSEGLRSYERWLASMREPLDISREAFVECPLAHPTWMLRREVLTASGYQDAPWPEDYDLVLRLLEAGRILSVVPERLLHWRDGSGRLSRNSATYGIQAFTACKAEYLTRGFLRSTDTYLLWGFGDTGKALAAALADRGKHPAGIVELHPGRLGQLIRGVRVVPPSELRALPPCPLLVSVAGQGPRTEIRAALAQMGFREGAHYVCCA